MTERKMPTINPNLAKETVKRKTYAAGWHMGPVVNAYAEASEKNGNYKIVTTMAALKDHKDPASLIPSPTVRHYVTLPFENTSFKDHKPPKTGPLTISNMRGYFGVETIPFFPSLDKENDVWMFNGEIISPEDVTEKREEVATLAFHKALDVYKDPSMLVRPDFGLYFEVKHDGGFSSVNKIRQSLPDGVTCVPGENILVDMVE